MYKQPDIYQEAEKWVRSKAKFYKHLVAFAIVNGFILLSALFSGDMFAPVPMTLMWGIGLGFHYLKVFGVPGSGVLSRDWEDKEYRKELEKLAHKRPQSKAVEEQLELKEMAKSYRDSDLV